MAAAYIAVGVAALLSSGTVMAYGQTGAGKTFTMVGDTDNYRLRGLIPRAISHIFQEIRLRPDLAVTVRVSYAQIYNEAMSDLLSSLPDWAETHPLTVVEVTQPGEGNAELHVTALPSLQNDGSKGVTVKGLSMHLVHNEEEALNLLFEVQKEVVDSVATAAILSAFPAG